LNRFSGRSEESVKKHFRAKASEYIARAEELKEFVEKAKANGEYQEQIKIENDSVGHSYEAVFGRFLDKSVTKIFVSDPYIRIHHQVRSLFLAHKSKY
jgi:hypothetical protein